MKTVLITGATGFIGKNVIEKITQLNKEFSIIAYADKNDVDGIDFLKQKNVFYLTQDNMHSFGDDIDVCIHLASYGVAYGARDVELMIDVNVRLAARIALFCSTHNCSLFINTGSCFEYGSGFVNPISEKHELKPDDLYAASKVACEIYLNTFARINGLKTITIRPFAVFGKYEPPYRLFPMVFDAGKNKKTIDLTGGEQVRDYMYASDVADAIIQIIKNKDKTINGEAINICSGVPITIKELILLVADSCGFDASLYDFGKKPYRDNESMYFVGDNKRLFEIIGPQDYKITREKIKDACGSFLK